MSERGKTYAEPLSLLLRLVARCVTTPAPTHPLDASASEPLCVLSERQVKLALVRKHGGEALLVKAFLAETSTSLAGSGNGSCNGNGENDNDMVRIH